MRTDWIKPMIAAARFPIRSDPENNQFERQVVEAALRSGASVSLIAVSMTSMPTWCFTGGINIRKGYSALSARAQRFCPSR